MVAPPAGGVAAADDAACFVPLLAGLSDLTSISVDLLDGRPPGRRRGRGRRRCLLRAVACRALRSHFHLSRPPRWSPPRPAAWPRQTTLLASCRCLQGSQISLPSQSTSSMVAPPAGGVAAADDAACFVPLLAGLSDLTSISVDLLDGRPPGRRRGRGRRRCLLRA